MIINNRVCKMQMKRQCMQQDNEVESLSFCFELNILGLRPNINSSHVLRIRTSTAVMQSCATNILYPAAGGNMHCFTAKNACAVLDVLCPPYDDSAKRHCAYYNEFPCSSFPGNHGIASTEAEMYSWLEERDKKPEELVVLGAQYRGPKVVED